LFLSFFEEISRISQNVLPQTKSLKTTKKEGKKSNSSRRNKAKTGKQTTLLGLLYVDTKEILTVWFEGRSSFHAYVLKKSRTVKTSQMWLTEDSGMGSEKTWVEITDMKPGKKYCRRALFKV